MRPLDGGGIAAARVLAKLSTQEFASMSWRRSYPKPRYNVHETNSALKSTSVDMELTVLAALRYSSYRQK
jgi:hypothetical protein